MSEQVRVGIIGAGGIARTYHVPELMMIPNARITAICSRSATDAAQMGAQVGATWTGTSPEALLSRADVDAVLILTPNHTHQSMVQMAAAARKPMLLQKPMGRTVAECQAMITATEATKTPLVLSFMHRYLPEVQQAREYLSQGLIGQVETIRIRNAPGSTSTIRDWFYQKELVGGGCALDIGVHGIDLLRYLVGEVEEVLSATTATFRKEVRSGDTIIRPDNEDFALAAYRLSGGALVTHEISWSHRSPVDRFSLELYGSEGSMVLRSALGPLALISKQTGSDWIVPRLTRPSMGIAQHQAFFEAIRPGAPITPGGVDGLRAVAIVHSLYQMA